MAKIVNTTRYTLADFKHMRMFPLLKGSDHGRYADILPACTDLCRKDENGLQMVRYMILTYALDSPYRENVPLLEQRKVQVGKYLGIYGKDWYDSIAKLEHSGFVDAMAEFMKHQNNFVWSLIVQNEEVFYSNQKQVLSQLSGEGKDTDRLKAAELQGKLLSQQSLIRKELMALYSELTGNDSAAEAKIRERQAYTPEYIAGVVAFGAQDDDEEEYEGLDEEE